MPADDPKVKNHHPAPELPIAEGAGDARTWRLPILGGILLVLAVFTAYLPALRGDFVAADNRAVVRNPRLASAAGLRRIWLAAEEDQYQPLTYTTYWLERRIWGTAPSGYHLVNIVLHATNCVLVWLLLRKIGVRGALLAATLFALHPVNAESVAWIYERKTVLSGLFYFLSFAALFCFEARGRWWWYGIALLLFAAALLAKSSAVVLPVILLLYWWWRPQSWRWRNVTLTVPFFILAGSMAVLTVWYERHHTGASGAEFAAGFAERLARAGWIVAFYLGKFFAPYNLAFYYPRWSVDPSRVLSYVPHAVLAIVLIWLWAKRRTWGRPVLFALGSYLVTLLPILGFFDIYFHKISFVADHFQYLALVPLTALCVHGVTCGLDRLSLNRTDLVRSRVKFGARGLGVLVVATCWFLSWQRTHVFQNMETLCDSTLRRHPDSWVAHVKLGEYLILEKRDDRKQLQLALSHLKRALELKPEHANIHLGIGNTLWLLQKNQEALDYLRHAVAANPHSVKLRTGLAAMLEQCHDLSGAIAEYEEAVRYGPKSAATRRKLGQALIRSGRIEMGIARLQEAVGLRPDVPVSHIILGTALCEAGRFDEGIAHLREAVRLNPSYPFAVATLKKMERQRRSSPAALPGPTP